MKNLLLKVIDKNQASYCYDKWHYLGKTGFISSVNFGVFLGDKLMGCISYGSPNSTSMKGLFTIETQKGWFEIKRLALSDELPKNSESHTIGISTRLLRKMFDVKGIITYADDGVGHKGIIYKATGFKYLGLTAPKCDYYIDGKIKQRGKTKNMGGEWKPRSRKHLFIKVF